MPVYRGVSDIVAVGEDRLRQIRFRSGSGEWMERPASVLLIHEGIVPSVHATMATGCDHVWSSANIAPKLSSIEVLRQARGWERPSDHVPVIARFDLE